MALSDSAGSEQDRKRRIRRNALWLMLVALAFYVGFIVMGVRSSLG